MIESAKYAGFVTLMIMLLAITFLLPAILLVEGYALGLLIFPVGIFFTVFVGDYLSNVV